MALAAAFVIAATTTGGFFGAVLLLPSWPQKAKDLSVQLLDRYRGGVRAIRRLERVKYVGGS